MDKKVSVKKSIFAMIISLIFAMFAFALVGCDDKYTNMKLTLSKTEVTLTIEGGVSSTEDVFATIEGDASISRDVAVNSSDNRIQIVTTKNKDKTKITVSATDVCQGVVVTVKSLEGSKTATFVVNVIVPVKNLSATTDASELFVVKGSSKPLNVSKLVVFEPLNTTQKDVIFSLVTATSSARIEKGKLIVDKNYPNSTIQIKAQSEHLGTSGTIIDLNVLAPLDESTVLFSSISYENSSTSLLNVDNSVPSLINMTSNLSMSKTLKFVIKTQTLEEVTIKPYISSTETYTSDDLYFDSATKKSSIVGGVIETEYTVLLNCREQTATDIVYFEISYQNYNFTYTTAKITINVKDAVNDIQTYINGTLSINSNLKVYDKYSGTQGLQLSFEALPTTLSLMDRTLVIKLGENAGNYYFWKKGQSLPLNDETNNKFNEDNELEIKSGEIIYISANVGNAPSAKITIYSKNNNLIKKEFTLQANYGTTSIKFLNASESITELSGDVSYHYYLASNEATLQTLKFRPDIMDITELDVAVEGTTISLESQPVLSFDYYYFNVKSLKGAEGTSVVTLNQKNGYYVKAYIHVIYTLKKDEVVFSVPSSQTSSSVGFMEVQSGKSWQFKVAIKKNNSVTLTQEGKGVDEIEYSYYETIDTSSADYATFFEKKKPDEVTFESYSKVLNTAYLPLQQITIEQAGKVIVKALVKGFDIEVDSTDADNPKTKRVEKSFETYFFIEGYIPVDNIKLSQNVVNLYAQNSVGYDDLALTTVSINLEFNKDASYSKNITWQNCVLNTTYFAKGKEVYSTVIDKTTKSLTITALSTWGTDENDVLLEKDKLSFTFFAVIKEFNTEYRVALTVNIIKAQQVEKIIVENVNLETGLYLPLNYDGKEIRRTIDAVVQVGASGKLPFNSNLVYELLPSSSLSVSDISLNRKTGELKVLSSSTVGGIGTIRVAPADKYNLQNKYEAGENDIAVYIKIVVADGQTRDTAYRITSLSDLDKYSSSPTQQSAMHFTLMNDITINSSTDFAIFENFKGGLYGAIYGDTNYATINTNKTLFGTIEQNACVEDLIVCGNVEGNAFVANTNNGVIENVSIDAIEGEQKQFASPSVLTATGEIVGGICGTNAGVIENCLFSGQIDSTNLSTDTVVGGIAGLNTNTISNCAVEFYSYAKIEDESITYSFGKITATQGYVGGIVGQMDEDATLTNSYAKSYASTTEILLEGTEVGALIGNFVKGNVDVCFAEIDNKQKLFAQHGAEATVNNAYILFGNQTNGTYFVNGIEKTFAQAKTDITTNDTWKNENTDAYPTFKNVQAPTPILEIANKFVESEKTISNNCQAIMFYYDVKNTLTLQETFALNDLNFVSFEDLFGEHSYGIRAISSDIQIISTSSTGLNLQGVGEVKITFYSKYDATLTKDYTVYVMNPVKNLTFVTGSIEFGANDILNVKSTQGVSFSAKVDNTILLDERKLNFAINQLSLNIEEDFVSGANMGPFNIDTTNLDLKENYIHYNLQTTCGDDVNDLLKTKFTGLFVINIYKGADKLDLDISTGAIEPIEYIELKVVVLTDDKDDDLLIELAPNANYPLDLFQDAGEYEVVVETIYYLDADCVDETNEGNAKYFKKIYTIHFAIQEKYKNLNFENSKFYFTINTSTARYNTQTFGTKDLAQLFVLEVSNQQILSASVAHYENTNKTVLKDSTTNTNFVFYKYNTNLADSTIAPGEEGLLKIDLFPTYSKYDYLTVTYSTLNNKDLKMYLTCMEKYKYSGVEGFRQSVKSVTDLENGIRINVNSIENYDNVSTIYLGTYIPISIEEDTVFVLTIRAYNNDEIIKETQFNLVVEYTSGAIMSVVDLDGNAINATCLDSEVILNITIPKANGMTISEPLIYGCVGGDVADEQIVQKRLQIIEDSFSLTRTYKYSLYIGRNVTTKDNSNYVTIEVVMTWMANGKMQNKTTSTTLPIVEFLVNDIQLSTARQDKTIYYSYIGIESALQFDFNITPNASPLDSTYEPIGKFLQNCYYESLGEDENSKYIVNFGQDYATTFLRNLYYVEGSILTPLCNSDGTFNENTYFKFLEQDGNITIVGKRQGEVKLRFVMQTQYPAKIGQTIKEKSFDFTIIVTPYSDEDMPLIIDNENAFWNAVNTETAQNYILMSDLYLENVSPINTKSIASLDGNNYTIHILSWATDSASSALKLALFDVVEEETTLKNLTVNIYHATNISVDTNFVTSLEVAGFAITNNGVIYNCEVVAYKSVDTLPTETNPGINLSYSGEKTIVTNVAGFVITNNRGYIVNSRVGGISIEKVNKASQQLEQFNIIAQGNISGFVDTNSGTISSCFFANGTLTNTLVTEKETTTNGFVRTNNKNIIGSYVKGTGEDDYCLTGQGITTAGIGSGFAYFNKGTISNCYSNILLASLSSSIIQNYESGRLSAGFVYQNTGTINTCFSSSKIENAKNTQMAFVGVDEKGDLLNSGKIQYAYYYVDENIEGNVYSNESSNLIITRISDPTDIEKFYGFTFATNSSSVDGVWVATDFGVDLVSANQIAISKRNVANQKYDETTKELLSYNLPYEKGYEYGSVKNPIIIRSAQEFNLVFGGDDEKAGSAISTYYSLSEKYVTGNYRLVCDINLQELNPDSSQDVNISSTQMELRGGVLDGNMMTISGIDLTANTDYISNHFGLFASLTENACIKNLNLTVISISAKKVKYVGTLAGSVENSKVININVQKQNSTKTSFVLGNNVVGGLVALVYGDSEIKSIVVDSLSVKANALAVGTNQTYNRTSSTSQISNLLISYAGGVVGVADIYSATEKTSYSHSTNSNVAQLSYIIAKGEMQIRASTVGGVVGYLGPQTTLRDATFESTDNATTKIIAYNFYAGGIVGECQGNIDMVRAEHSEKIQKEIEDNIGTYYHNPGAELQRGNLTLFEDVSDGEVISTYEPIAIGGLVGMLYTGEIQHSYSKVNVVNSNVKYAGGVIGQISSHTYPKFARNEVTLFEVYAFGDVYTGKSGFAAGGIVGYIDSERKISMAKVNAVNYWSVQYNAENKVYELPTNIYQIYAMTNATANNVLALNDIVNTDKTLKGNYNLPTISYTASNNLMYAVTEVKFHNKNSVTTQPVQKSYASQVLETKDVYLMVEPSQSVTPYYDLDNSTTNGFAMNAYFIESGWDTNYWIRYTKTNDLLPSLVTYSGSMTYYIDVASDLQKMIYHPYATFIVRALGQPVTADGKHLVKVGSYIENTGIDLRNFSGTLKGFDSSQNYGFDFEEKTSFISATTNATFKNLAIINLGKYVENVNEYSEVNQAFVDNATLTTFENMWFNNCYTNSIISSDNYNLGIVANSMIGGSLKNISMQDCAVFGTVNNNDNKPTEANLGIVCGKAETSGSILFQVQDVYVYQDPTATQPYISKITQNCVALNLSENVNLDDTTANLGAVIGQTSGNIVTIYSTQNATSSVTKHIGIACEYSKIAYNPMDYKDSIDNHGTSLSITGKGKINSANVGVVYGNVTNSIIKTSNSQSLLVVGNIKNTASIDNLNCGGVVGCATSSLSISGSSNEEKYVNVDVDIDVKATNVNAGMIAGTTAQTNTIDNIDTYGKIVAKSTGTGDVATNIGGFVGSTKNNLSISQAVSRTDINYSGTTIGKLGGLVGCYETSTLNIGDDDYNTKYLGTITIDANTVFVGGIVGEVSNNANATLNNAVFGGNIKFSKIENDGKIYAGGLVGSTENANGVLINNSISYGEINLPFNISQNTKIPTIYLGGLLGIGNGHTTLSNNASVSTIASKTSATLKNININALVGDAFGASGSKNFYSHQASLCLDLNEENIGATNDYYPTLQNYALYHIDNPDSLEDCLTNYINTLSSSESKEECPENSKLNPYVISRVEDWTNAITLLSQDKTSTLFVVFNNDPEGKDKNKIWDFTTLTASANLKNVQIVGNGSTIKLNKALFSTIDQSSAVSGLQILPDIQSATSTQDSLSGKSGVGTIANVNNGYVFACTVVSSDISKADYYELKVTSGYGGGLVGVNTGVIMDCMASININGNPTTGGLVGYNFKDNKAKICGVIVSSYSVGTVKNGYAFSSGEGEIYASYTASIANNGVFGSNAKVDNSFYDIYAVGSKDEEKFTASTNNVAILDKAKENNNFIINVEKLFGDYTTNKLKFSFVESQNFGYPTFSGDAYKEFTYMQGINTGNGTKDNPIMINSVGKLQQISLATTPNLYYKLICDIAPTTAMETVGTNKNIFQLKKDSDKENYFDVTNWKPIVKFKGNLDGQNYKISNLTTTNSGEWAVFGAVGDDDNNTVIKNVEFNFGSISIGSSKLSTVATSITKTTLQNISVIASSLTSTTGSVSGLVGSATNSTIGNATGGITMKISTLKGSGNIGGLIADTSSSDTSSTITNVKFDKDLTITATGSSACVGGIFGNSDGNVKIGNITLQNVTFSGDYGMTAGGIAGSSSNLDFESNGKITFNGTVTLNSSSTGMVTFGGLVGKGSGSLNLNSTNVSISKTVSITQTGSGALVAGGVVGDLSGSAQVQLVLSSTLDSSNAPTTYGGIVGQASGGTINIISDYTLPTSISISTTTTNNIGGIVGYLNGGKVTTTASTKKTVSGTFSGTVSNASSIGAVVGTISTGTIEKINVNGSGLSLSGTQAGGVAGVVSGGTVQNVNVSSISFDGDAFGVVAGKLSGGTIDNVTVSSVMLTGKNIGALAGSVSGGTIKNFTVSSGIITGKADGSNVYVGALAPTISGATLENITVASGVSITADSTATTTYLGGFTGKLDSGAKIEGKNTSAVSKLSATGTSYVGGIAGTSSGTISGVTTSGTITSSYMAGGVAAEVTSGTISGCTNKASITCGTQKTDASTVYAGGIVAYFSGTSISGCENSGDVTAGWQKIGNTKLSKDAFYSGEDDENDQSITTNYIENKVKEINNSNNNDGSESSCAGGIAGYVSNCAITNPINNGSVRAYAKITLDVKTGSRYNHTILNIGPYDAYCHYAIQVEKAYASGIVYLQNNTSVSVLNPTSLGNVVGGGFYEFNIYSNDNYSAENIYSDVYILGYYQSGDKWQNSFSIYREAQAGKSAWENTSVRKVAYGGSMDVYTCSSDSVLSKHYTSFSNSIFNSYILGELKLVNLTIRYS